MSSSPCPYSFQKLDRPVPGDLSERVPRPGDVTVCLHCQAVLEFTETMAFKPATDEKLVAMGGDRPFKVALRTAEILSSNPRWRVERRTKTS